MKKYLYTLLALGAAFAVSCSKTGSDVQEPKEPKEPEAVTFGAYMQRSTTKAGLAGETLTTSSLGTSGFGVFAYYSNGDLYSGASKPDFMYNEKVYLAAGNWYYSPLKYWPNEFGADAQADDVDRLTFFAYAPYVEVNTSTGVLTSAYDDSTPEKSSSTGIISLPRNSATGDPIVKYVASLDPSKTVDLCWGVAAADYSNSVTTGVVSSVSKGYPYIDVAKPTTGGKINLDFKHALAQLNVQVDTDVDVLSHNDGELNDNTRIYVRSVTFEGFAMKGALNLNSNAVAGPNWLDYGGSEILSQSTVTVYDGRRDGKEGVANAAANDESPLGLNSALIQSMPYASMGDAGFPAGVQHTAVNLFSSATASDPVYVIPTGSDLSITIAYDVETVDENLLASTLSDGVTHGSTISNVITGTFPSSFTLEAGKNYKVNVHIGMTSVQFNASVSDWDDGEEQDVNLPINASVTVTVGIGGVPVTPGGGTGI